MTGYYIALHLLISIFVCGKLKDVDGLNVTIMTGPAGVAVDGQPNTFDFPILTNVTLMCVVNGTLENESSGTNTVPSYHWDAINCTNGTRDPCFYGQDQTSQNITGSDLLAQDAGTVKCIATINGSNYFSNPLTLRISGIKIIGHYGQTATDMVVAKNVLDDYSAIILSNDFLGKRILFRCSSGLGIGSNDSFGGLYFNSNRIFYNYCNGFVEPSVANTEKHPGVLNMRVCGELTTSTEGVYTCRLMNSSMMYQNMSVGVYLNGRTSPVITAYSSLSNNDVAIGSPLTLTCTSSGSPPDTFTWMKDDVLIMHSTNITTVNYTNDIAVFTATYIISNFSTNDIGTYTCTVSNPIGSDNKTIIGYPPPLVEWRKLDGSLSDRASITNMSLLTNEGNLTNVTVDLIFTGTYREDTGVYECSVSNLLNTVTRIINLTVQFAPSIESSIENEIRDQTENATFLCHAVGEPVPGISWYFNGVMINVSDNSSKYMIMSRSLNITTTENTLTVYNVTSSDAGTYTCSSTNIIGTDASSRILTVTGIATVNPFNHTIVGEGNATIITCEALGYPPPTVVWNKLDGNFSDRVSMSDSVSASAGYGNITRVSVNLTIINASREDTGEYMCSANNSIGSDDENMIIIVHFCPEIIPEVNDLLINDTSSAIFTCLTTGVPIPSIKWYFNGNMINLSSSSKYNNSTMVLNRFLIESNLSITDVELSDVGTYTCEAENIIGKDQSSGVLIVNENVMVTTSFAGITILQGDNVTLSCVPSQSDVDLQWSYNNSEVSSSLNHQFAPPFLNHDLTITNANDTDSGSYVCAFESRSRVIDQKTINLTVVPTCLQDFSGGLLWPTSSRDREVTQRCSILHPSFRSGVFISRKCNADGTWGPVDESSCTAQSDAIPTLILSFAVNVSQSKAEDIVYNIIHLINNKSDAGILSKEVIFYKLQQTNTGVLLKFTSNNFTENSTLPQIIPNDIPMPNNTLFYNDERKLFIPGLKCECSLHKKPERTICIGPSIPPCDCSQGSCKCNSPFVGNNGFCGLDTDSDGCPDEDLGCTQPNCKMDLCANDYTEFPNCHSDNSTCNPTPAKNSSLCLQEVDVDWNIAWPTTNSGQLARQKCPGGAESIGLATRLCNGNPAVWNKPNVENCTTVAITRIKEEVQNLMKIFENIQNTNNSDRTVMIEPQILASITSELANLTEKNNTAILPNDLSVTINTVETILSFAEQDPGIATEETLTNIVNICDNIFNPENGPAYAALNDDDNTQEESESVGALALRNVEIVSDLISNTLEVGGNKSVNFSKSGKFISIEAQLLSQADIENGVNITFPLVMATNISAKSTIPNSLIKKYPGPVSHAFLSNSFLPSNFDGPEQFNQSFPILVVQINAFERVNLSENDTVSLRFDLSETLINNTNLLRCAFWQPNRSTWSDEGVSTSKVGDSVECITTHLTSFSVLVNVHGAAPPHGSALSIISYIGCGVSIIFLLPTMLAIGYWRKSIFQGTHNFIHLNMSVSLIIGLIIFVSGIETAKDIKIGCTTVAALLHYFFLAAFMWMLCEGIYLFIYFNYLFYTGFFVKKQFYFGLGWGLPVPIVAISIGTSKDYYGSNYACWLSEANGTIWAFLAPMLLIIAVNSVFLAVSLRVVFKHKKKKFEMTSVDASSIKISKTVIASAFTLMPLLGVTWIIGLLAVNKDTVIFAWIFTILNSLQGFSIFLLYVLKQKEVRNQIKGSQCLQRFTGTLVTTLSRKTTSTYISDTKKGTDFSVLNCAKANQFRSHSASLQSSAKKNTFSTVMSPDELVKSPHNSPPKLMKSPEEEFKIESSTIFENEYSLGAYISSAEFETTFDNLQRTSEENLSNTDTVVYSLDDNP